MANLSINFVARANTAPIVSSLNQIRSAANSTFGGMRTEAIRVESPLNKLNKQVQTGRLGFRDYRKAIRGSSRIIAENNALLRSTATSYIDASGNAQTFLNITRANAATQATFAQRVMFSVTATRALGRQMIATGKNIQWAGRQVMIGLTLPLVALGTAATRGAEEFDKQITRVVKVTNLNLVGAADEMGNFVRTYQIENEKVMRVAIDSIERQANRLTDIGASMGFMADETAKLAAEFSQMGFAGFALDGLSESALRLSRVSGADLTDSMNIARLGAMAFGKELGDGPNSLIETFARLNLIENQTSLSLAEMAGAIPIVAGVARNLSIEMETLGGMLALMKDQGIEAREGATSLRTGLIRLVQDATDPAIAAFERLGVSITDLQEANQGQVFGLIVDLAHKLHEVSNAGEDAAAKQEMFIAAVGKMVGTRAASRFTSMLQSMGNSVEKYTEVVEGHEIVQFRFAEGVKETDDAFRALSPALTDANHAMRQFAYEEERVQKSLAGQAEILRAQLNVELRRFGRMLLPIRNRLMEFAVNVVQSFNNLSDGTQRFIGVAAAMLGVLGPATMIFGVMTNALGQLLVLFTRFLPALQLTTVRAEAEKKAFQASTQAINASNVAKTQAIQTNQALAASTASLTGALSAQNAAMLSSLAIPGAAGAARAGAVARSRITSGTRRPGSLTPYKGKQPATGEQIDAERVFRHPNASQGFLRRQQFRTIDAEGNVSKPQFRTQGAETPIGQSRDDAATFAALSMASVMAMTMSNSMKRNPSIAASALIPSQVPSMSVKDFNNIIRFDPSFGAKMSHTEAIRQLITRDALLAQLPEANVDELMRFTPGTPRTIDVMRMHAVREANAAYELAAARAVAEGRNVPGVDQFMRDYWGADRARSAVLRAGTEGVTTFEGDQIFRKVHGPTPDGSRARGPARVGAGMPRELREMAGLSPRLNDADRVVLSRSQRNDIQQRFGFRPGRRSSIGAIEAGVRATRGGTDAFLARNAIEEMVGTGRAGFVSRTLTQQDITADQLGMVRAEVQRAVDEGRIADTPDARGRLAREITPERARGRMLDPLTGEVVDDPTATRQDRRAGRRGERRDTRRRAGSTLVGRQAPQTAFEKGLAMGRNAVLMTLLAPFKLLAAAIKATITSLFGIIPLFRLIAVSFIPTITILTNLFGLLASGVGVVVARLVVFGKELAAGFGRRVARNIPAGVRQRFSDMRQRIPSLRGRFGAQDGQPSRIARARAVVRDRLRNQQMMDSLRARRASAGQAVRRGARSVRETAIAARSVAAPVASAIGGAVTSSLRSVGNLYRGFERGLESMAHRVQSVNLMGRARDRVASARQRFMGARSRIGRSLRTESYVAPIQRGTQRLRTRATDFFARGGARARSISARAGEGAAAAGERVRGAGRAVGAGVSGAFSAATRSVRAFASSIAGASASFGRSMLSAVRNTGPIFASFTQSVKAGTLAMARLSKSALISARNMAVSGAGRISQAVGRIPGGISRRISAARSGAASALSFGRDRVLGPAASAARRVGGRVARAPGAAATAARGVPSAAANAFSSVISSVSSRLSAFGQSIAAAGAQAVTALRTFAASMITAARAIPATIASAFAAVASSVTLAARSFAAFAARSAQAFAAATAKTARTIVHSSIGFAQAFAAATVNAARTVVHSSIGLARDLAAATVNAARTVVHASVRFAQAFAAATVNAARTVVHSSIGLARDLAAATVNAARTVVHASVRFAQAFAAATAKAARTVVHASLGFAQAFAAATAKAARTVVHASLGFAQAFAAFVATTSRSLAASVASGFTTASAVVRSTARSGVDASQRLAQRSIEALSSGVRQASVAINTFAIAVVNASKQVFAASKVFASSMISASRVAAATFLRLLAGAVALVAALPAATLALLTKAIMIASSNLVSFGKAVYSTASTVVSSFRTLAASAIATSKNLMLAARIAAGRGLGAARSGASAVGRFISSAPGRIFGGASSAARSAAAAGRVGVQATQRGAAAAAAKATETAQRSAAAAAAAAQKTAESTAAVANRSAQAAAAGARAASQSAAGAARSISAATSGAAVGVLASGRSAVSAAARMISAAPRAITTTLGRLNSMFIQIVKSVPSAISAVLRPIKSLASSGISALSTGFKSIVSVSKTVVGALTRFSSATLAATRNMALAGVRAAASFTNMIGRGLGTALTGGVPGIARLAGRGVLGAYDAGRAGIRGAGALVSGAGRLALRGAEAADRGIVSGASAVVRAGRGVGDIVRGAGGRAGALMGRARENIRGISFRRGGGNVAGEGRSLAQAFSALRASVVASIASIRSWTTSLAASGFANIFRGAGGGIKTALSKAGGVLPGLASFAGARARGIRDVFTGGRSIRGQGGLIEGATARIRGSRERLVGGFSDARSVRRRAQDAALAQSLATQGGRRGVVGSDVLQGATSRDLRRQATRGQRKAARRAAGAAVRGSAIKGGLAKMALGTGIGAAAAITIPIVLALGSAAIANPEQFKAAFNKIFGPALATLKKAWDDLTGAFRRLMETIRGAGGDADGFGAKMAKAAGAIAGFIGGTLAAAITSVVTLVTFVVEAFQSLVMLLQGDGAGAAEIWGMAFRRVGAFILDMIADLLGALSNIPFIGKYFERAEDSVRGWANGMRQTVENAERIPNLLADASKAQRDLQQTTENIKNDMKETQEIIDDLVEFGIIDEDLVPEMIKAVTVTADMTAQQLEDRKENVKVIYDELTAMTNITDEQKAQIAAHVTMARLESELGVLRSQLAVVEAAAAEAQREGREYVSNERLREFEITRLQLELDRELAKEASDRDFEAIRRIEGRIRGLRNEQSSRFDIADLMRLTDYFAEQINEKTEEHAGLVDEVNRQLQRRAQFQQAAAEATADETERMEELSDAADEARRRIQALQNAMGELMGDVRRAFDRVISDQEEFIDNYINSIVDAVNEYFDNFESRFDEQTEMILDSLEERAEKELELIDDIADAAINKLEEEMAEEERLERKREEFFRKEKARIDFLTSRRAGEVRIQEEILRGNLAQAAILQIEQRGAAQNLYSDIVQEREGELKDERNAERQALIQALEQEREFRRQQVEIALEAAQQEVEATRQSVNEETRLSREGAIDQVRIAQEAIAKIREAEERRRSEYLRGWERVTPASEEEFARHTQALEDFMTESSARLQEEIEAVLNDMGLALYEIDEDFIDSVNTHAEGLDEVLGNSRFVLEEVYNAISIAGDQTLASTLELVEGFVDGIADGMARGEKLAHAFRYEFEREMSDGVAWARNVAAEVLAEENKWAEAGDRAAEAFMEKFREIEDEIARRASAAARRGVAAGLGDSGIDPEEVTSPGSGTQGRYRANFNDSITPIVVPPVQIPPVRPVTGRSTVFTPHGYSDMLQGGTGMMGLDAFAMVGRRLVDAGNLARGWFAGPEAAVDWSTMSWNPDAFVRYHTGGMVEDIQKFHTGGFVGNLRSSEVPAVLEKGEYVIQRSAVSALGTNFLDKINNSTAMFAPVASGSVSVGESSAGSSSVIENNYNLSFQIDGGNIDEHKLAQKVMFEIKKVERSSGGGRRIGA